MRLGFSLRMQQAQRLLMTPELRQAITILTLPVAELEAFIKEQLQENPCLEAEWQEESEELSLNAMPLHDFLAYLEAGKSYRIAISVGADAPDEPEAFLPARPTLHEHLMAQLRLAGLSGLQQRIGAFLIGNIDDAGYVTITAEEVAAQLHVAKEQVLSLLQVIQGFEPLGVGARSLQECLRLQCSALGDTAPLVACLIDHHLKDIEEGRIPHIAAALGVTPGEVQMAVDLIRTFDPRPGRQFGPSGEIGYVIPDVVVERVARDYVVLVNEERVPQLKVSREYRQMLSRESEPAVRKFVQEKIHDVIGLMRAIEQRRLTLYRVAESIIHLQRGFFDHGIRHLQPLALHQVAAEIGVHESTVSRATAGKYMQTPQGIFPFKFFFSSGVESTAGKGVAQESVKRMIADLIAAEQVFEPLSDQLLTDRLNRQGIRISRRTVTKYRESMGIPNSERRRRYR